MLRGLLAKPWIEIVDLGSMVDEPARLRSAFQMGAPRADVIISAGGVSVGDETMSWMRSSDAVAEYWVRKVAIKPGKPLALGKLADATYIGLPGNPGALFTTFKVIVDDILAVRAGIRPAGDGECAAVANFDWKGRPGRTTYLPRVLTGEVRGLPTIELLPDANSGKLHRLSPSLWDPCRCAGTTFIERGARANTLAAVFEIGVRRRKRAVLETSLTGARRAGPRGSADVAIYSLSDAVPSVLAGGGRLVRRMFKFMRVRCMTSTQSALRRSLSTNRSAKTSAWDGPTD